MSRSHRTEGILLAVAVTAALAGIVVPVARPIAEAVVVPEVEVAAGETDRPLPTLDLSGLSRAELDDACQRCHVEVAAQWRGSPHHTSFVDPVFQRSFAREPRASCQGCHAPEADPEQPPPQWAADRGITCVTCHLDADDRIMATTSADMAASPHDLRLTAELEGDAACARCHEFDFPRTSRDRDPGPMQLTIAEHGESDYAQIACADCHMAPEHDGGPAGHGFHVTRNETLLRDAITVAVDRTDDGRMVFDLASVGVGHRFPTGDLFRRLEIRAEVVDDEGHVVDTVFRYLARHFPPPKWNRDRHAPRPEVPDDRLDGAATIELALPAVAAPHAVRWSVRYQRVDQRFAEAPETSTLAGEIVLAEGWA